MKKNMVILMGMEWVYFDEERYYELNAKSYGLEFKSIDMRLSRFVPSQETNNVLILNSLPVRTQYLSLIIMPL